MSCAWAVKPTGEPAVALLGVGHERLSSKIVTNVRQILRRHAQLAFEDLGW